MIQANELRIGNWIEDRDTGRIGVVSLISKEEVVLNLKKSRVWLYFEDLKPIPLTEEILLKCGFEKVEVEVDEYYDCSYEKQLNSDVFISYADDFSCSLFGDKCDSLKAYGVLPDWQSTNTVHGLQNLHYILTGQELKIEL